MQPKHWEYVKYLLSFQVCRRAHPKNWCCHRNTGLHIHHKWPQERIIEGKKWLIWRTLTGMKECFNPACCCEIWTSPVKGDEAIHSLFACINNVTTFLKKWQSIKSLVGTATLTCVQHKKNIENGMMGSLEIDFFHKCSEIGHCYYTIVFYH